MKKPQVILGFFHVDTAKSEFMKNLCIKLRVCLLATLTVYAQASSSGYKLPEVAPGKDDNLCLGNLKEAMSLDDLSARKKSGNKVTFSEIDETISFEKHVTEENKNEYFFTNLDMEDAIDDLISKSGMTREAFFVYERDRHEGHRLRVKGVIKYDKLEKELNDRLEKELNDRVAQEVYDFKKKYRKQYADLHDSVKLYQGTTVICGTAFTIAVCYIYYLQA